MQSTNSERSRFRLPIRSLSWFVTGCLLLMAVTAFAPRDQGPNMGGTWYCTQAVYNGQQMDMKKQPLSLKIFHGHSFSGAVVSGNKPIVIMRGDYQLTDTLYAETIRWKIKGFALETGATYRYAIHLVGDSEFVIKGALTNKSANRTWKTNLEEHWKRLQ